MRDITEVITVFNELDILEAHLEEHKGLAERTILVESDRSTSGLPKPLYVSENRDRFERFNVEFAVMPGDLFERIDRSTEQFATFRRNDDVRRVWNHTQLNIDTTWILNIDVDEILDSSRYDEWLPLLDEDYQAFAFWIDEYMAQVNCRNHKRWSVYRLKRTDLDPTNMFGIKQLKRRALFQDDKDIDTVGWHFTNCQNTAQAMREKAQTRPWYYDVDRPEDLPGLEFFESRLGKQLNFILEEESPIPKWFKEPLSSLPKWMVENIHKFPVIK